MYAEKLLPNALNAVEVVIGALLIDGDSVLRGASLIKPGDFYCEKNRLCFMACVNLFQRSEATDQEALARASPDTVLPRPPSGIRFLGIDSWLVLLGLGAIG
jgi:replicative DNA helicase